jgi:hypothetical protein
MATEENDSDEAVKKWSCNYVFSTVFFAPALLLVYPWPLAHERWVWNRKDKWMLAGFGKHRNLCDGWVPYYMLHFSCCACLLSATFGRLHHMRVRDRDEGDESGRAEIASAKVEFKTGSTLEPGQLELRMALLHAAIIATVLVPPLLYLLSKLGAPLRVRGKECTLLLRLGFGKQGAQQVTKEHVGAVTLGASELAQQLKESENAAARALEDVAEDLKDQIQEDLRLIHNDLRKSSHAASMSLHAVEHEIEAVAHDIEAVAQEVGGGIKKGIFHHAPHDKADTDTGNIGIMHSKVMV